MNGNAVNYDELLNYHNLQLCYFRVIRVLVFVKHCLIDLDIDFL